jgi:hypothetical protein
MFVLGTKTLKGRESCNDRGVKMVGLMEVISHHFPAAIFVYFPCFPAGYFLSLIFRAGRFPLSGPIVFRGAFSGLITFHFPGSPFSSFRAVRFPLSIFRADRFPLSGLAVFRHPFSVPK